MQLQAGYLFDFVKHSLLNEPNFSAVLSLLDYLCYFEVDTNLSGSNYNDKPELAVINNLLSRGLPTRPSMFIENTVLNALNIGEMRTDTLGSIETIPNNSFNSISQYLYKALHIIDPRVNPDRTRYRLQPSFESSIIGSQYEEDFLFTHAPNILGDEWFQLLESQREFTSIANYDSDFTRQRTDFTIEFPFPIKDKKGIIIEIDGPHHWENQNQKSLDDQRDLAAVKAGWFDTLRIKTIHFNQIENHLSRLKELSSRPLFQNTKFNYQSPLYFDGDGLKATQLILSPFAIARVQKVLIQYFLQNKLNINSPKWRIAIIERDVPCAAIAIVDLCQQIKNIFALQDKSFNPEIELTIITTQEFNSSSLSKIDVSKHFSKINISNIANPLVKDEQDILIDISVLQRKGYTGNDVVIPAREKCIVRSAHHKQSTRTFLTSDIISYSNIVIPNEQQPEQVSFKKDKILTLEYFLQYIFRKEHFRPGQLDILNKALQGQSVIGLLPTGGGKSLTYQLSAMMQPGICLVIDPIKSLMKDQHDSLINNQIDACNFINSSLNTRELKIRETTKLKNGEVLISFVSPERLQMKEFRDILLEMHDDAIYFNYCVIDEAHCVSEWGHDFRTPYLSLGKNAIEYCKTKNRGTIPLFGLTATASFDVLSDIQRELSGNNDKYRLKEDSIVRFDTVNRQELNYEIINVSAALRDTDNEWKLKEKLGNKKQTELINLLSKFPFDNRNDYSGIIFCPHRGWYFGVTDRYKENSDLRKGVYDSIQRAAIPPIRMGSFMGSDSDDERIGKEIEADSIKAQEGFIDNKLNLLVSTKAFGMGIDKPNIRFTVHLNYPSSIESFVQEAGRAGRDRRPAKCFILFNDEQVERGNKVYEIDRDNLLYFHNLSFKGVEKEKTLLIELLSAIHVPNKLSDIEVKLYEKFQQDINLNLRKSNAGYWYLFVKGDNFEDSYGAIKLPSLQIDTRRATRPVNECNDILNFISSFIRQNAGEDVLRWLKASTAIDGIEVLLQKNENIELAIPFYNNITERIDTISTWLNAAFNTAMFVAATTRVMLSNSNSFDDFKDNVTSKIRNGISFEQVVKARDKKLKNKEGTAENNLQRLFDGFRLKPDTEKALYRLSTVGVIDDYTVNFNSKTFTLTAKRKKDEEYFLNLENYIRKYYSEVRTKKEVHNARRFEGKTAIQKCLFFLTDFVYREIAKKRYEGIGVMKEACEIGKESGGEEFKGFVDLYFNSKYARKGYEVNGENKSLTDRTDEGKKQDIKWVWEFIEVIDNDKSGGHKNNQKHLRGACMRLLIPQPDNAVFHLLKAFSLFMLDPDNKRLMDEASNSFSKGFIEFQQAENWTFRQVLIEAEKYKEYILQFSTHPGIQEIMQNQITNLSVIIHSKWLETFNKRFLKHYEPRYSHAS